LNIGGRTECEKLAKKCEQLFIKLMVVTH